MCNLSNERGNPEQGTVVHTYEGLIPFSLEDIPNPLGRHPWPITAAAGPCALCSGLVTVFEASCRLFPKPEVSHLIVYPLPSGRETKMSRLLAGVSPFMIRVDIMGVHILACMILLQRPAFEPWS